ncbi:MAG: DUF756 domain-containing protein, partial [Verrucomicrobiaceae bacterium]
GTIRREQDPESLACVRSSGADYGSEVSWTTFPERLEDLGVPWKVYQNEISLPTGLSEAEDSWLSNFTDNPLEWFTQYRVRFAPARRAWLAKKRKELEGDQTLLVDRIQAAAPAADPQAVRALEEIQTRLKALDAEWAQWSEEKWSALPERDKALHRKAFTNNAGDPDFRSLETMAYQDGEAVRRMQVPKGDVLHQFREDARTGNLPAVSWLVAPQLFSDHPDSPWYGSWYLAEAIDILTKNPEVWKKTIFILCYDENDGYYDHIPPFVPPVPGRPETGAASPELNPGLDLVTPEQERTYHQKHPQEGTAAGPIGLGFRVPLLIASPWSRGGMVCSEVFDHTSILQFLEVFVSHKTGKTVREPNISPWRRAVCGDLTSVFQPWHGEPVAAPEPLVREKFFRSIHQAQFKPLPQEYRKLTPEDIALAKEKPRSAGFLPRQEPGTRSSCALPYELSVHGSRSADGSRFAITFAAGNTLFGEKSAGAPFHVYAPGHAGTVKGDSVQYDHGQTRAYTAKAGGKVTGDWSFDRFVEGLCHLRVHGPNGFFREFRLKAGDPDLEARLTWPAGGEKSSGGNGGGAHEGGSSMAVRLTLTNRGSGPVALTVEDPTYGNPGRKITLAAGATETLDFDTGSAFGWHDLLVRLDGIPHYIQRFAGRIETGKPSV